MGHLLFDHLYGGGEGDSRRRALALPPHCGKPETANCTPRLPVVVVNGCNNGSRRTRMIFVRGIRINDEGGML